MRLAIIPATLVVLLTGAASAQTTTTCQTYGSTTRCTTNLPPSTQPTDQGSILRSGRDVVPQYRPTIRQSPPPDLQAEAEKDDGPARLPQTGNDLLALCDRSDTSARMTCLAWVIGFDFGLAAASASNEANGQARLVCYPERVTLGQVQDVVLTFVRQHPEARHEDVSLLSMLALRRAFPCPAQQAASSH